MRDELLVRADRFEAAARREVRFLRDVIDVAVAARPRDAELADLDGGDPIRFDRDDATCRVEQQRRVIEPIVEQRHPTLGAHEIEPRAGDEGRHIDIVHADVDEDARVANARREDADAARRHAHEFSELPARDEIANRRHRGVVAFDVADHQRDLGTHAAREHTPPGFHRVGDRLLDEERDASVDELVGDRLVQARRHADDDGVDARRDELLRGLENAIARVGGAGGGLRCGFGDPDELDVRHRGEIARVMAADRAESDDADPNALERHRRYAPTAARMPCTTASSWSRSSDGPIGKATICFASRSEMGKSPGPYPYAAKSGCRCRGVG